MREGVLERGQTGRSFPAIAAFGSGKGGGGAAAPSPKNRTGGFPHIRLKPSAPSAPVTASRSRNRARCGRNGSRDTDHLQGIVWSVSPGRCPIHRSESAQEPIRLLRTLAAYDVLCEDSGPRSRSCILVRARPSQRTTALPCRGTV